MWPLTRLGDNASLATFQDAEGCGATLTHDRIHRSARPTRLARERGKRFGSDTCATETLIAVMGAAFLRSIQNSEVKAR